MGVTRRRRSTLPSACSRVVEAQAQAGAEEAQEINAGKCEKLRHGLAPARQAEAAGEYIARRDASPDMPEIRNRAAANTTQPPGSTPGFLRFKEGRGRRRAQTNKAFRKF
jgi:hypothetical protein